MLGVNKNTVLRAMCTLETRVLLSSGGAAAGHRHSSAGCVKQEWKHLSASAHSQGYRSDVVIAMMKALPQPAYQDTFAKSADTAEPA